MKSEQINEVTGEHQTSDQSVIRTVTSHDQSISHVTAAVTQSCDCPQPAAALHHQHHHPHLWEAAFA